MIDIDIDFRSRVQGQIPQRERDEQMMDERIGIRLLYALVYGTCRLMHNYVTIRFCARQF